MPLPNLPTLTKDLPGGGDYLQAPIYTPTQENVFERLLQLGGQRLDNPQAGFQPYEDRARSQFYQNTIPGLAERFTAMGGGQRSSAFQGALGQAGSDLEAQLAQLRQTYGQQQEQSGLNMLGVGLTPQYNQAYYQPTNVGAQVAQGVTNAGTQLVGATLPSIINRLGGNAGNAAGTALGTAAGTAAGAGLGAAGTAATTAGTTGATTAAGTTGAAAGTTAGTTAAGAGLAGALKTAGAIAVPAAAIGFFGWWVANILKKEPYKPEQFPNPLAAGNYTDADGNRVVSTGNTVTTYDANGNVIGSKTFAGANTGTPPPVGSRSYNYFGTTKPVSGPFTRGS